MSDPAYVPPELVERMLDVIHHINGDLEFQILVVVVKSDTPPTMVSSIHPDQVPEILAWLIEHHKSVRVERNDSGTSIN